MTNAFDMSIRRQEVLSSVPRIHDPTELEGCIRAKDVDPESAEIKDYLAMS